MKRFSLEDNGCPCADCERFYGSPYDPGYRERRRRQRAYEDGLLRAHVRWDRERLIQLQED